MNEIKNNKMENSYLGRSWYFVTFSVAEYPPPLENSYLGRSWYFVIFQLQITPPWKIHI